MFYLLAQGFWFILPAMYSNMAPLWVKDIAFLKPLDIPIDGGATLRGKPLFGRNKTYRGFLAGAVFAVSIGIVQYVLSEAFPLLNRLEFIELDLMGYVALSLLLGFGALAGDAIESLFKRQMGVPPGESWKPFDQIDYVVGALLMSIPIGALSPSQYLAAAAVGVFLHPVGTFVGWKLGMKDKPI